MSDHWGSGQVTKPQQDHHFANKIFQCWDIVPRKSFPSSEQTLCGHFHRPQGDQDIDALYVLCVVSPLFAI